MQDCCGAGCSLLPHTCGCPPRFPPCSLSSDLADERATAAIVGFLQQQLQEQQAAALGHAPHAGAPHAAQQAQQAHRAGQLGLGPEQHSMLLQLQQQLQRQPGQPPM